MANDLAILKLEKPATLSKNVITISLFYKSDGEIPMGSELVGSGWGRTDPKEPTKGRDKLRRVSLPRVRDCTLIEENGWKQAKRYSISEFTGVQSTVAPTVKLKDRY